MSELNEDIIARVELDSDREAMAALEHLIPEIIEREETKRGTLEFPLMIHHIQKPKLGGHQMSGQPGEYFINFDLHRNSQNYVLDIGLLQVESGATYDALEPSELSVMYGQPGQESTMMSRGKLDLVDFADILQDYLRTSSPD